MTIYLSRAARDAAAAEDDAEGGGGGGGKDQTWETTKAKAEARYGPLGLSPLKKLEKIKAFEAQLEADKYERKIKQLEEKQLDPTYMMRVMGKAREKAMQAAPRAMMGPQATEIARAGMTGQGSPGALAEAARQVGAGAQQATGQQAVQAGGQASQGALQAQQAMMAHLQSRKAAALGQYAPPGLSYGEQLGQELLTTGVESGIAALGEKGAEGLAEERRQKEQMNVPETPP